MSIIHPKRRGVLALAAAAVAVVLLAGCTGPSEPAETAGAADAPPLTVSANSAPNSLDPAQLVDGAQTYVWSSIFDTLLARDSKTTELIPNAAKSWEYNEDGTELTLVLQEGMTFTNGNPVNAEAVVGTMTRTMATPGIVQPKYAMVSKVEAVDDLTVKLTFTAHDPQFVYNLALGAGAIGDPSTFEDPALATSPVGSGPYTLDAATTVPGTTYVLKKRKDYWNTDDFPFPTFTVRVLQDPTATFNALQAGEVNAATVQPQLKSQIDTSKFTVTPVDAQALAFLDILDRGGEKWPALGDVRVRQAINYAIDREEILNGIYAGVGTVTEQVFSPNGEVYDEALNDTYAYDPEKGKALVEEAGYAGETFQIPSTFLTTSIEPALSQAFTDIGLSLEWVPVPPQQAQSALQSGDYGMTFQITGINSDPADAFYHYGENGFGNPRNYTDSTIDGLFETINSTVELESALPSYKKLNEYGVDQAFEAPILFLGTTWVTADGVTMVGYGGAPFTLRIFGFSG